MKFYFVILLGSFVSTLIWISDCYAKCSPKYSIRTLLSEFQNAWILSNVLYKNAPINYWLIDQTSNRNQIFFGYLKFWTPIYISILLLHGYFSVLGNVVSVADISSPKFAYISVILARSSSKLRAGITSTYNISTHFSNSTKIHAVQ